MTAPSRAGVLFDVDGTLVDTNLLHVLAWHRALRDAGIVVPTVRIQRLVGMGADTLLHHLLGDYRRDLDEGYARHFHPLRSDVAALPGARDLLAAVHRRGGVVVLATSSKPEDVEVLQDAIGARDVTDVVITGGDVRSSKPSGDIFRTALERAGLTAEAAVVVGDTVWDVHAAAECGLRTVALRSGGVAEEALRDAGAVAVYEDPSDLLAHFDESPLGSLLGGLNSL